MGDRRGLVYQLLMDDLKVSGGGIMTTICFFIQVTIPTQIREGGSTTKNEQGARQGQEKVTMGFVKQPTAARASARIDCKLSMGAFVRYSCTLLQWVAFLLLL